MVEMLVCQHNMRYLATSDLLDVGRDCCCFAEGGPGVDEQYSGAAPDQPNGDVTERQPAAMHAVGQALPVEVHNRKGNAPPNLLITRAITEGCSRVRPVKPDKENIMRAVVITKHGDPSVLQVRQRPDPPPPGPGQLRVAVRAAGVNFADHLARVGLYPDAPKLPAVVGYEVAGTVEAVGDGVDPNRVGERVLAGTRFGGYCEIVNVAATDSVVLPDALSFEQGAAVPVNYATAWAALHGYGSLRAGERVLIHAAAGGVGIAAVQFAKAAKAEVHGTASPQKHQKLAEFGVDRAIDYRRDGWWQGLGPYDVVLDALGGPGRSPTMLATDLSLRVDPIYERITRRWLEHPEELADEFAKAWYKLIHRDMGPVARYLGPLVPKQTLLWQDPVPAVSHDLVGEAEIASLKSQILASGLTVSQLVSTAWAAASSFRGSDKRGGANGGRIRLQPQVGWEVNDPDGDLRKVIRTLEEIQESFNSAAPGNIKVSFADLVVLGGCAAIEKAAKAAGHNITVPFTPGRTDASQEQTDVESFAVLEPKADGFRNYLGKGNPLPAEYMLLDKANLLTLSAPEMTVLVGGLRVLGANYKRLPLGVFTEASESLTNDFFVNLLDMGITWEPSPADDGTYQGKDGSGKVKWTGSRVDLVFGSNSELRALVEVYGADDAQPKFVQDFVAAWDKVMNLDRFDVR